MTTGHYSWPCNVFGNKCFYGVGFRTIACDRYLRKVSLWPWNTTSEKRVYEPRGVVLTHVVVTFNRSICSGHSRSRYFLPRCEFRHGLQPALRKYPDIRASVWCDSPMDEKYEGYGRPLGVPISDTHNYDAGVFLFCLNPPLPLLAVRLWGIKTETLRELFCSCVHSAVRVGFYIFWQTLAVEGGPLYIPWSVISFVISNALF